MNEYFKPRTPEPASNAAGIVIGSMICALVVVVVGTGIWMGMDTARQSARAEDPGERAHSEHPTNTELADEGSSPP